MSPTIACAHRGRSVASSSLMSSARMSSPPFSLSRSMRPWPISPLAPVTRTTGFLRMTARYHARSWNSAFAARVEAELNEIRESGLWKEERRSSRRRARRSASQRGEVLCFCANNYLGLANDPRLVDAAARALKERGLGLASVRFICGTQDLHKDLEQKLAAFLGFEDAILYTSCFDANGGLFETLLGEEDAIICDALNHASIIDGIRLSKAERLR